jgi:hypothetical protein
VRALEHLVGSRPARIGIILLWLILGGLVVARRPRRNEKTRYRQAEADSMPRTHERYSEQPAALAASDTPDDSS